MGFLLRVRSGWAAALLVRVYVRDFSRGPSSCLISEVCGFLRQEAARLTGVPFVEGKTSP
jgi:hypothetical protein